MAIIGNTPTDYKNAAIALSPKGACWPTDDASNWVKLLDSIAQEFARVDGRTVDLYAEGFPDTTVELIGNWERVVGLPDAFSNPDATLEERRQAVLFKLQARGGQTVEYLVDLINTLGYQAKIIEAVPFRADLSCTDDYLFDDTWAHIFIVFVQNPVSNPELLEGRIRSVQPAQTKSIFVYVDDLDDY